MVKMIQQQEKQFGKRDIYGVLLHFHMQTLRQMAATDESNHNQATKLTRAASVWFMGMTAREQDSVLEICEKWRSYGPPLAVQARFAHHILVAVFLSEFICPLSNRKTKDISKKVTRFHKHLHTNYGVLMTSHVASLAPNMRTVLVEG